MCSSRSRCRAWSPPDSSFFQGFAWSAEPVFLAGSPPVSVLGAPQRSDPFPRLFALVGRLALRLPLHSSTPSSSSLEHRIDFSGLSSLVGGTNVQQSAFSRPRTFLPPRVVFRSIPIAPFASAPKGIASPRYDAIAALPFLLSQLPLLVTFFRCLPFCALFACADRRPLTHLIIFGP